MLYLTYDEYNQLGGDLDNSAFTEHEFSARKLIDRYTFNRLQKDTEIPEDVKMCVYKLIKLYTQQENALILGKLENGTSQPAVTSQSNDGVSISYNALNASQMLSEVSAQIPKILKTYLTGVKNQAGKNLLYKGLYDDE